ncbi:MAG: PD40 domain-containing protein [Bacteroidia bacterium]|nr:PD40 domain-containing protein [Bacteroidia bacterium]
MFSKLLEPDPENAKLNYWIGQCYLYIPLEKQKSIEYLKKAVINVSEKSEPDLYEETLAPVDAYFYLAKAFHKNYKFEEALEMLDMLKNKYQVDNPEFLADINKTEEECKTAMELVQHPIEMKVQNLGQEINSGYSEHSPVFSADESVLIFTSKREGSTGGIITEDVQYWEDIYISYNKDGIWSPPVGIGSNINTSTNEATIGLSADGQQLFIYRDDNGDGNIYFSSLEGDIWTIPVKMESPVNSKAAEKHASLSADKKSLYFSSNRKGGLGGIDLYVVRKLPNGLWGEPQNLGLSINTKYNEEGPYIHPDGVTLFFSSQGHKTMGGYDIFVSNFDEEKNSWNEPVNIGYPVNTTEDDIYYTPTVDGKRAYYSSYQQGGLGNNDIYIISLPETKVKPLAVFTGIVMLFNGNPPKEGFISVVDKNTGDEYGVYTPNSKTGKYLFILPVEKEFILTYEAENNLSYKMNLIVEKGTSYEEIQKAIHLPPVVLGGTVSEYILQFDDGTAEVNQTTENQIKDLAELMIEKKEISAKFISDSDQHFEKLIRKREEIIADKLGDKGVEPDRIISSFSKENPDNSVQMKISADDTKDMVTEKKEEPSGLKTTDNIISGRQVVVKDIFYDFDKYQTDIYYDNMNILAEYLVNNPDVSIEIVGHTDAQGSDEYNERLSLKRANFIKEYLVKKGANKAYISTKGEGEDKPIALDASPETRKYNRRAEIYVKKNGRNQLVIEHVKVPEIYKIR